MSQKTYMITILIYELSIVYHIRDMTQPTFTSSRSLSQGQRPNEVKKHEYAQVTAYAIVSPNMKCLQCTVEELLRPS